MQTSNLLVGYFIPVVAFIVFPLLFFYSLLGGFTGCREELSISNCIDKSMCHIWSDYNGGFVHFVYADELVQPSNTTSYEQLVTTVVHYIDTVRYDRPVSKIYFQKTLDGFFGNSTDPDNFSFKAIEKNSLFSISVNPRKVLKKYAGDWVSPIREVTFHAEKMDNNSWQVLIDKKATH